MEIRVDEYGLAFMSLLLECCFGINVIDCGGCLSCAFDGFGGCDRKVGDCASGI